MHVGHCVRMCVRCVAINAYRWRRHIWHTRAAQRGWTALICAAMEGHADCARLLLDAGADKYARNKVRLIGLRACPCCDFDDDD